ncbi:hypothetical protein BDW59DRAFT_170191 [Aspergillus cavernicola]|uniref:tRNA (uracil-O(2)-)-methyltransferase n=1 Tax=Aspergillus cavernicola TaxID=176166 RepID=A0ABR4ISL4_9EURO
MGRTKKTQRDVARLSGKPLSETLEPSLVLSTPSEQWVTSPDLTEYGLPFTTENVRETTFYLLANPGLNSTVLFRADILFDSHGEAATIQAEEDVEARPAWDVPRFELIRTVVRRLIPRNPQLDHPLDQTCHLYLSSPSAESSCSRFMVIYTPHVCSKEELPYYHPQLQSLAFQYEYATQSPSSTTPPGLTEPVAGDELGKRTGLGTMSIHFRPYTTSQIQPRLERSLSKFLEVNIRLTKISLAKSPAIQSPYAPIKDNVIPRHRVQDTYSRLKATYAGDLMNRWVESTESSKHVFEDLGVAAFLVELWRDMYGVVSQDEHEQPLADSHDNDGPEGHFPGFVDIACGNGVLVYILLKEGYRGWGFDARRRKTWSIFPEDIQECLKEEIYIPKPFADELLSPPYPSSTSQNDGLSLNLNPNLDLNLGPQKSNPPFLISNHADELTLWTPLLATLLSPKSPAPFLAIPCCSHSLSGARYRHPPPPSSPSTLEPSPKPEPSETQNDNNKTGDLNIIRKTKQEALKSGTAGFNKSTYGTLTEKLVSLAREVGYGYGYGDADADGGEGVAKTLLRIPSTRNIGVLAGVHSHSRTFHHDEDEDEIRPELETERNVSERRLAIVREIVARECVRDGGVYAAAKGWVERARGLKRDGGGGH